jgi:hypothetical protein
MSSPRFTLFAGRTCSGPFRPWGPLPHLSQCRSFRLLARNGFNVAMLSLAQHEKMMRMQDMKTARQAHGCCRKSYIKHPQSTSLFDWLTSTLQRHSFGIIMLCLGPLATTPVGSSVPGLVLAIMAVQLIVGRTEPVFPRFIMTRRLPTTQLLRLGCRAIYVLKYLGESSSSTLAYDI